MKKIAVLGAGGTGHTIAADLALDGHEIRLYEEPRHKDRLQYVLMRGGIGITGAIRNGFARLNGATTEIHEALEGAEIIFVSVVASRHEKIAELCAPYLEDGQTVVIGPDNGGSLIFANVFKRKGVKFDITIAGIGGNFYSCRLVGPAEVFVGQPNRAKRISAFPGKDTSQAIINLDGVYDFVAGTNVLEIALSSPNIPNHLAATLLNTGAIENSGGNYYLYREGITPSVVRCTDAVSSERSQLFDVLSYSIEPSSILEKVSKQGHYPELDMFRALIGPTSMQHRYITEDAPTGMALMVSLANMVNGSMPVSAALIALASAINKTDYLAEGRTVQKLELSGMNIDELNTFLAEGSY